MGKILFLDACVRAESRTRALAGRLLAGLGGDYERFAVCDGTLPPLAAQRLAWRADCCERGDFSDAYFAPARQFAAADEIVIAAPFWDNSFPAALKKYIESVCITGLTFRYGENGVPQGMCRARRLYYVTTAGGPILNDAYGYGYIQNLAETMFGIEETVQFKAEGLDIFGADENAIMAEAGRAVDAYLAR